MRYTRKLYRELVDRAVIEAERFFTVRFAPHGTGYRLEGEESAPPVVTGPAPLERFLELERERRETGLFPIRLESSGRIVGEQAQAGFPQLAQAIEQALQQVRASGLDADNRSAAADFLIGMQAAAASLVTRLPAELFRPSGTYSEERREVPLPDGRTGALVLKFSANTDVATGLMQKAERVVVTQLGQSARRTVETWSLSPAG